MITRKLAKIQKVRPLKIYNMQ